MFPNTVFVLVGALGLLSVQNLGHDSAPARTEVRVWPDPHRPPVWPPTFRVTFQELLDLGPIGVVRNNGTWYYNYSNLTARFDHQKGQKNNFCQGQGLSPKDPSADCHLLFTQSKDMWVIYPDAQSCCRLCGVAEGCTVLKPDWLKDSRQQRCHCRVLCCRLTETIPIEGRACAGWAKRGAVAPEDTWYVDEKGVPCRYHEVVDLFQHNLTFVAGSYSTESVDPAVFALPNYCRDKCPHPYLSPHH